MSVLPVVIQLIDNGVAIDLRRCRKTKRWVSGIDGRTLTHFRGTFTLSCDDESLEFSGDLVNGNKRLVVDVDDTVRSTTNGHSQQSSKIGTYLREIILKAYPGIKECSDCKMAWSALNRMTPADARAGIDDTVKGIAGRAAKNAPQLWQRLAVRVDQLVDYGETERRIRKMVEEAIGMAERDAETSRRVAPSGRRLTGSFGTAFRSQGTPRFVTSRQFQEDIKLLISKVPSDITAIAGVARSGLSAATMVSMYLHLPMFTIRQNSSDIQQTGNGWRLGGKQHVSPKTGRVLVVDDTVMTGNSLRAIGPLVQKELGHHLTAVVYVNPLAKLKPDIHAVDLGWPHLLEWNLFNSVLSPNMATDFDGVLCHDCPPGSDDDGPRYMEFIRNAKPLYLSRKAPIPLIVTARIEKYRPDTMKWLERWGIKCHRLVMHPATTLAERNRDNIPAYKARHFSAWARTHRASPPPLAFIESEDRQAKAIARITQRMVICPATAGVY